MIEVTARFFHAYCSHLNIYICVLYIISIVVHSISVLVWIMKKSMIIVLFFIDIQELLSVHPRQLPGEEEGGAFGRGSTNGNHNL